MVGRAALYAATLRPFAWSLADLFRVPTLERGCRDDDEARQTEAAHRLELIMAYSEAL